MCYVTTVNNYLYRCVQHLCWVIFISISWHNLVTLQSCAILGFIWVKLSSTSISGYRTAWKHKMTSNTSCLPWNWSAKRFHLLLVFFRCPICRRLWEEECLKPILCHSSFLHLPRLCWGLQAEFGVEPRCLLLILFSHFRPTKWEKELVIEAIKKKLHLEAIMSKTLFITWLLVCNLQG